MNRLALFTNVGFLLFAVFARRAAAEDPDREGAATSEVFFDVDLWQSGISSSSDSLISLDGTCFESYWDDLPDIVQDDDHDGTQTAPIVLSVDGHSFQSRMAVLKFLMFRIDPTFFWEQQQPAALSSGGLREWHWLWAYAAQLDWQHRSGRLAMMMNDFSLQDYIILPGEEARDRISPTSWWGYMNFCFSIAILLGLEQSGMLKEMLGAGSRDVIIQLDLASEDLVATDNSTQLCIDTWKQWFLDGYTPYKNSLLTERKSNNANNDTTAVSPKLYRLERFNLQKQVWKAHTEVIHSCDGSERFNDLIQRMPTAEQNFGLGWAKMVEILAACCLPTDLVSLRQDGAGFLPLEILTDDQWSYLTANRNMLTGAEKRRFTSVQTTHDLNAMPLSKRRKVVAFWERIARTDAISRSLPATIIKLYHGSPLIKLRQLFRILVLWLRPREWVAVTLGFAIAALLQILRPP